MKAAVFTLGCKVNECESDALISALAERGFTVTDRLEPADIYIVNTCAVTREAERKSRQAAERIKKLNPSAKIIFTGCAAQKDPASFCRLGGGLVTGVFGKNDIPDMLTFSGAYLSPEPKEYEEMHTVKTLRSRAFIKVQDGCDSFCSYCIIPYLRGRSRSRALESVLSELAALSPAEAVITGIDLSSYNYKGLGLAGLVAALKDFPGRLRLGSLEERVIDRELLENLAGLKNFAPHFHLSLQSGSDAVLKKMNRKYTASGFLNKVRLIREYFPAAGITTDIIAGFPTETEEDFNRTVDFVDEAEFSDIHPFTYSPRSGTAAYRLKDLPAGIKKARTAVLLEKKAQLKNKFAQKNQGAALDFLAEEQKNGVTEGYSGNYLRLYVKGDVPRGKTVKVRVTEPYRDGAFAELIK